MATTPYQSYLNGRYCDMIRQQQNPRDAVSQRLLELSKQQRYQALHDLHGVSDTLQEPPELIEKSLKGLDAELQRMHLRKDPTTTTTSYYELAKSQSPHYVQAQHLKFLRARYFDTRQTAELLERFFELKFRLFGSDKLTRDIHMTDLTPEDIEYWKTGYLQILSRRDMAGRKIMFYLGKSVQDFPILSTIRNLFVLMMKFVENEEDQKKGIVSVYYGVGQTTFHREKVVEYFAARDSLPYRGAAIHQTTDNMYLQQFLPLVEAVMSKLEQCRNRFHIGSHTEIQYNLMTFGVPKEVFPVSADGALDPVAFQRNNAHLLAELSGGGVSSSSSASPMLIQAPQVTTSNGENQHASSRPSNKSNNTINGEQLPASYMPGPNDVILGRHTQAVHAPGNIRMRQQLEECHDQYDAATHKVDKMVLTHHVFKSIKERGGRFLKQSADKQSWIEVTDDVAREKVSLGFGNLRRRGGKR